MDTVRCDDDAEDAQLGGEVRVDEAFLTPKTSQNVLAAGRVEKGADVTGYPDAVLSIIGELVAFDHFRQRVALMANAFVPPGATDAELDRIYDEAVARVDQLALDGATPLDEPLAPASART